MACRTSTSKKEWVANACGAGRTSVMNGDRCRGALRRRDVGRGFSLIEILVVMGIIVLLVALALPAFSFITGARSTEAAGNQIAAAMGVARANAVGLQKVCGVMFFVEPTSDHVQLALVQETDRPSGADTDNLAVDSYLDLVADTEFVKLPVGVGIQTVTNALLTGGVTTTNDRYIGFNTAGITSTASDVNAGAIKVLTRVGGVILFDGNGQLTARTYALRTRQIGASGAVENRMGALLFYNLDTTVADTNSKTKSPADYIPTAAIANAPVSQLGFVLFDANVFATKFKLADYRTDTTGIVLADEQTKEAWLDENGTPTMINRFNGTLVRGE